MAKDKQNNKFAGSPSIDELSSLLGDQARDIQQATNESLSRQASNKFAGSPDVNELSQTITQDGEINLPEQGQDLIDLPETQSVDSGITAPTVTSQDIQRPEQRVSRIQQLTQSRSTITEDVSNTAKTLANSIKQVESGGDPQAQGASGEGGAFQFMPATWKRVAEEITGNANLPQTPANEQMVAEAKIEDLLQAGNTEREVALIWNTSLGGAEEPKEISGVNDQGVEFDSGQYANRVMQQLQQERQGMQRSEQLGRINMEELTKDTTPGFFQRVGDTLQTIGGGVADVGRGGLNLAEGLGRAALSPIDTGKSLAEGIKQGAPRLPSMFARAASGIMTAGTEVVELPWEGLERLVGEENYEAPDFQEDAKNGIQEWLRQQADKFSEEARERIEQGEQIEGTFIEKLSNPEYLARDLVGRNIPTMAPAAAASMIGGLPAAFITGGTMEGGAALNEIQRYAEETGNEELANNRALQSRIMGIVGIGAGALDALGIEAVLDNSPIGQSLKQGMYGRIARDVANGVVGEGATEPVQEIIANAAAQTYNENRDLFAGAAEALVAGGLTGGAGSFIGGAGNEFVAQGMPIGLSIRDISDETVQGLPEEDRDQDTGDIIAQLEQNSQQVGRRDFQALNQTYEILRDRVENNPARELAAEGFGRPDGTLNDSEQAQEFVEQSDNFDNFTQAQQAFEQYTKSRGQLQELEQGVRSDQFSVRQVIQKVQNAEARTRQQVRQEERRNLRQELRQQQDDITNIVRKIRDYAKQYLPKSERGRAMSLIENAAKARKTETRQRRLGTAFGRINEIADQARKKELRNQVQQTVSRFGDSPSIAPRFRERIKSLMDGIDLTGLTDSKRQELESTLEFVQENSTNDVPVDVLRQLSRLEKQRWEDVTVEDLESIQRELQRLIQLGKTKRQAQESKYEREKQMKEEEMMSSPSDVNTIAEEAERRLGQNYEGNKPDGMLAKVRQYVSDNIEVMKKKISNIDKALLPSRALFELMGPQFTNMKQLIDRKNTQWRFRLRELSQPVNDLLTEYEFSEQEKQDMVIVAAREQPGGRARLKKGNGLTDEQIDNVELNEKQREVLELAKEQLDKVYPELERRARELENKQIEQIPNYLPFIYDTSGISYGREIRGDLPEMVPEGERNPDYKTKRTEDRPTQERVDEEQLPDDLPPLDLNFGRVFAKGIADATYYSEMAADVRQYYEVANSDEFKEMHGAFTQDLVTSWLSTVATRGGWRKDDPTWFSETIDKLRRGTTAGMLAFKASTALIQSTALFDAMLEVNPKNLAQGLYSMATDAKARDFVKKMPEIQERVAGESAMQELKQSGTLKNKLVNYGFMGITGVDNAIARATALGAYLDYAQENNITVDWESDPDPDGVVHAQQKVEATQSNNEAKDRPLALSVGQMTGDRSVDQALLQFQSFMLRRWAQVRVDAVEKGILSPDNKLDGVRRLLLISTAVMMEAGLSVGLASALGRDDDEDEDFSDRFYSDAVRGAIQTMPLGGNILSMGMYRSSPVPVMSFLNQTTQSAFGAITGEEPETKGRNAVKALVEVLGASGVPGGLAQSDYISEQLFPEGDDIPSSRGGSSFGGTGGFESTSGFSDTGGF